MPHSTRQLPKCGLFLLRLARSSLWRIGRKLRGENSPKKIKQPPVSPGKNLHAAAIASELVSLPESIFLGSNSHVVSVTWCSETSNSPWIQPSCTSASHTHPGHHSLSLLSAGTLTSLVLHCTWVKIAMSPPHPPDIKVCSYCSCSASTPRS